MTRITLRPPPPPIARPRPPKRDPRTSLICPGSSRALGSNAISHPGNARLSPCPLASPDRVLSISWSMDAIDRVVMNSRLHYLGMAARIVNPMLKLALLTCMDARLDPSAVLGLRPGDAHIIRNAGGRASHDAMHAIAISQAVLGTREVMVLHHT